MRETVCVTGASGGIGQAVLEQLIGIYEVRALFRTKSEATSRWEARGCTPVWGDLENEAALAELVKGARFVIHCAALVTAASYEQAHAVNVEGTRRVARLAALYGCRRFVHLSSVAVYTATEGDGDYTEDMPLPAHSGMAVYALTKLQAERALQEVSQETGLEYTILRPTSVYGPDTKSYTQIPIELIRKGLPVIVGDGRALMDVVYVDDVARAALQAANAPQAAGQVFNIGHETVSLNDFYEYFTRMLNRPARRLPLPFIKTVVRLLDVLPGGMKARFSQLRKGARFVIRMAGNTRRWPSSKAAKLFGYQPTVKLPLGMLRTEIWAKQQRLAPETPYTLDFYGPLRFRPMAVIHPVSEEDLVQIVGIARDAQVRVKAIGSLHSQSPIPETDGICAVLHGYNKLVSIDGSLVTVQAGMTLRDLNETLAAAGLALPTLGAIVAQTVSGAISTATHGGSLHYGALSDCVEALRIVRADGSIVEVNRSHSVFPAVAVSLGLLGIISTVTFRCVPAFTLASRSSVRTMQEAIDQFDEIHRSSLHIDMLYFPVTDQVEILHIDQADDAKSRPGIQDKPPVVRAKSAKAPSTLGQRLTIALLKGAAWILTSRTSIHRYLTRFSVGSSYRPRTGRSDYVLAFRETGDPGRSPGIIGDMEIAIPRDQARTAMILLRDYFAARGKFPLFAVHIRCSARSELWMSPAYQRDVCWLEFCSYPLTDTLFQEMHELLKPLGYRFHWGKETAANREYIRRQYEKWEEFSQLREEWDPGNLFLNGYMESFFPAAKGRASSRSAAGQMS